MRFVRVEDVEAIKLILMELAFVSDNNAHTAGRNGAIALDLEEGRDIDLLVYEKM